MLIGHFGHAILECLSRLWFVAEGAATERIAFLPTGKVKGGAFTGFYASLFELLGIDSARIIYIEEPTQFERVIVPDETVHVEGMRARYNEKYGLPYKKIMDSVEAKSVKKIYLTRTQLSSPDCSGEEYFEEFYRRRGFAVIAPEQHSIKEQIAYMKGADEIACTMGTLSHLALFASPGTRLTCLLRSKTSIDMAPAQMIVNQAKSLDFYIVDTSFNFLPSVHGTFRCFLIAPTKHWREYLAAIGEECAKEELEWEKSRFAYEYLEKWCAKASTRVVWTRGLAKFDTFDILNSLSTVLLEKPLKRDDFKNSLFDSIAIRIRNMDDGKKLKVKKALWKVWRLFPERARGAIIGLLERRKK